MGDKTCVTSRLCVGGLGVAFGVAEGLAMVVLAFVAMHSGHGTEVVSHMGAMYHGYAATPVGALIGGAYGFVVGFVFGIVLGAVYNCVLCCCCGKKNKVEVVK